MIIAECDIKVDIPISSQSLMNTVHLRLPVEGCVEVTVVQVLVIEGK